MHHAKELLGYSNNNTNHSGYQCYWGKKTQNYLLSGWKWCLKHQMQYRDAQSLTTIHYFTMACSPNTVHIQTGNKTGIRLVILCCCLCASTQNCVCVLTIRLVWRARPVFYYGLHIGVVSDHNKRGQLSLEYLSTLLSHYRGSDRLLRIIFTVRLRGFPRNLTASIKIIKKNRAQMLKVYLYFYLLTLAPPAVVWWEVREVM